MDNGGIVVDYRCMVSLVGLLQSWIQNKCKPTRPEQLQATCDYRRLLCILYHISSEIYCHKNHTTKC